MYNYLSIINFFYSENDPAREILLLHSTQVRNKALLIARHQPCKLDLDLIEAGAMIHDIGIRFCNAPDIGCSGEDDYLLHGILGAESIRALSPNHCEKLARICERHTGSGILASEIKAQNLKLPERDLIPESPEEKIICLADKFFSKSGDMREKSIEEIRHRLGVIRARTAADNYRIIFVSFGRKQRNTGKIKHVKNI